MFIAPQHFQQQDRHYYHYIERYIAAARGNQLYGFSELQIDRDRLKIGKFAITSCKGIFPDGTYFENDRELIIEVPTGTLESEILLAVPLAIDGEVEYGAQNENLRYFQENLSLFDASQAGNNAIDTPVAQINARLIMAGGDTTGLCVMPVARVLESQESGAILLDHSFIPAAVQYQASSLLIERMKELQVLTENRARMVMQRISNGMDRKSEQTLMREYLWLQTLNRWIPWIHNTLETPQTSTWEIYQQLNVMSAELASFEPSIAEPGPVLQSHNMQAAFNPMFNRLREQLSLVQNDSVKEYDWDTGLFEKRRLLRLMIPELHTMRDQRFILCVQSSIGSASLAQLFPSACKLCGLSQIADVVRNGLSAIPMTALPVAPAELKPQPDVCYIEIDTRHSYWMTMIEKREPLTLHVDSRLPDLDLKLYALG